ncbi:hypothetical protein ACLESD_46760 [Pyxidicoccus sp. 3LFB2]
MSVERAFRDALRDELGGPLSELMDRMLRVASGMSGSVRGAASPVHALAAVVSTPEPEACAVMGCVLPRGESGFCKAHSLQRQQMINDGRLHPEWVEGASPHSVPNVIPPRRRRGEGRRAAAPAPAAAPTEEAVAPRTEPRMWVRKKSDAAAAVIPTGSKAPDSASAKPSTRVEPKQDEQQQIAFTLGRWANEFKSRK